MTTPISAQAKTQQGFVLVTTIWLLAIIGIGAAYFSERVASSVLLARQSQQATEALIDMSGTRAEILFRLGTTRLSRFGVGNDANNSIALDNRRYLGNAGDMVRLQDSRGLINVNFVRPEMLRRLLGQIGVAAENQEPLLDALADYTDTDDLRRLNGAEVADYRARGLPPPPNDWLVSPLQLQNIIGWRDYPGLWKDQSLFEIVTTARVSGFNPNTAPRAVLAALPGSNLEIADNLIKSRAIVPFASAQQMGVLADQPSLNSDDVLFFPGDNIRLTQESDKIQWALQYQIMLTPLADRAPWRIDYYIKTGLTNSASNANKPALLPARITLQAPADSTL